MVRRAAARRLAGVLVLAASLPFAPVAGEDCEPRLLVLSAFPGEIDALLAETAVEDTLVAEGRTFYLGTLRGNRVALGLTGIGLLNTEHAVETAIEQLRCGEETGVEGLVFSGVSGGTSSIGDVTVPARWTDDGGDTWFAADAEMLAAVAQVSDSVALSRAVPAGDPACVGVDPRAATLVELPSEPAIIVGGDGSSTDPFGGRAFPCMPGGGDVFGCRPCRSPVAVPDVAGFAAGALPFADPGFFTGYFESPPASSGADADDMETGAAARVASRHGIPFVAFRALSDGNGDPLMLPGFPFQFFVYRQIAADNAAAVALAFLDVWAEG